MPIDYKEYHPKWSLISRLIRFRRAKNKCEWCGLQNGSVIKRLDNGKWRWPYRFEWYEINRMKRNGYSLAQAFKFFRLTIIVLTVAHLDHDKTNNKFSNLAALCQRCHLQHDIKHHAANRKYGRKRTGASIN